MSAAVCCTLAYLYWRAGLVRRGPALAVAILIPLVVGVSRIYLDVHWATDVLGGWSAGLPVAVLAAALCERVARARTTDPAVAIHPSRERS
jgi:undecaprenyl-diphosphatase